MLFYLVCWSSQFGVAQSLIVWKHYWKFWHTTRKRWKSSTKLWAHFLNLEIIMMEWMHSTFGADKMWKTIDVLTAAEKAHRSLLCKTIKWSLGNGVSFAMLLNSFEPTLPRRIAEHITLSKICQLCGYSACRTWDNFPLSLCSLKKVSCCSSDLLA